MSSSRRWTIIGAVAAALSLPAAALLGLLTLLSTNACGAFADGCDDYGEAAPGFELFAIGTVAAVAVGFVGLVVALVNHSRSGRIPQRPDDAL